jgi:hypothetical protein
MLTTYPARLVIYGEIYRIAEPKRPSKPQPSGVAPRTLGTEKKTKKTDPNRRPSHRRPRGRAAPARDYRGVPGGQFDLSRLRIPRHPEVQRAWQAFQEKGKFRARGRNKDVSWETLRQQDPQTAFELKRKFVEAWRKKLQLPPEAPAGSGAPEPAVAPAEEPTPEDAKPEDAKPEDAEDAEDELSDEDLEEVKDEPTPEDAKDEIELKDEDLEEEAPTIQTRHKPAPTRAPAEEEKPPAEEKPKEEKPPAEEKPEDDLSSLLKPPQPISKDSKEVEDKREQLEGVIQGLGLPGKLGEKVAIGPTVTSFTVEVPKGQDFDGEKLADRLEKDEDIKVIVGRQHGGKVEVQVPNAKRSTVVLRQVTDSPEFKAAPSSSLVLGVDPVGKPLMLDLAKAESPHVLVTGTTGSGKSVAIQSMLASVMLRSPKDTKLVVIDPKNEFQSLDGVPHLAMPRISDDKGTIAQDATAALHKLTREMDERVRRIGAHKDLKTYNEANPDKKMPRLVVVVDEFKDLMGESGGDFQKHLGRLLQKARSTGIHVIMGTQELTSGMLQEKTIRSNLPVRMAFRATSKQSSRNALGEAGAEKLMGAGDGLITVGGGEMQRFQAPYITDKGKDNEWSKLTDSLRKRGTDYEPALHKEVKKPTPAAPAEEAELPTEGVEPPEPPAEAADLQEVEPDDDDVANVEQLKRDVPESEISEAEDQHAKYFAPLGEMKRYNDGQLAALHKGTWLRQQREIARTTKDMKQDKAALKKEKDPAKQAALQKKIDASKQTQKEFEAAAKYHLDKISAAMGARKLKVPAEYEEPSAADKDPFGLKPDWGDYEDGGGAEREHTAPPVQVTRPETREERKERRQQEKEEKRRAKEPPATSETPATPTPTAAPPPAKTPDAGGLPSPVAPKPDQQAAHEHLREQGVSEEVAKHVAEMLSEPHDPQQLQQAMSKAVDKAVAGLDDPNAQKDVLATRGGLAHVLVKKFGAGTAKVSKVLGRMRKAAGGAWGALWGGIKKLFGAIGKGLAWLFKKIVHHAKRFGSHITGIEARRQARLNQATRHLHSRTPLHTAPVTAMVYYRGVPYVT